MRDRIQPTGPNNTFLVASTGFFVLLIVLLYGCHSRMAVCDPVLTGDIPFALPKITEPVIANRTFTITDFGAVGDGHVLNTDAFAAAMGACADAGGGRVMVPAGLWLTGPIELKSNLNLHLKPGAVILFSPDIQNYPLKSGSYEGQKAIRRQSPLSGENLENIMITGRGIIDGSGQVWRPVKKSKLTEGQWKNLVAGGGVVDADGRIWYPSEEALKGPQTVSELDRQNAELQDYEAAAEHLRPVMVSLVNCKNVLLDGPTFQNSPAWNIHPLLCDNMIIRNINIRNPWFSQNGDGLDLESCRNVLVDNCCFDVGDDAICMKSGRDEAGRKRNRPTENIVIRNCTVYHGHGGFVVGSEMSGGVKNIFVSDCEFLGTDVGLRFKSTRGRGGVVENIYIENIRMKDIAGDAIRFNLFYASRSPGLEASLEIPADPVTEETPRFQDIHMKNIVCRGANNAMYIQGLPEMPVQRITMENVVISADAGVTCIETDQIRFKNLSILPRRGALYSFYNARNVTLSDVRNNDPDMPFMKLVGEKTDAIHIKDADASALRGKIEIGKGTASNAIIWE